MDPIDNALMGWSDELGYEEIGYDELGRRILRPRRGGGAHRGHRPTAPRNPNFPAGEVQADRLFPLPVLSAAAIAAAGTGNATGRPQANCKPVRYVVHQVYDTNPALVPVAAWLINSMQIGQRLQAIAAGGTTGDMFSNVAVATGIEFDTAIVGQDVTVNVTDMGGITAAKTAIFRSTFLCKALHY